jgi:hypothetical protein
MKSSNLPIRQFTSLSELNFDKNGGGNYYFA